MVGVGRLWKVMFNEKKSYLPNLRGTEVARGLVVTNGADTEQDTEGSRMTLGNSLLSTMVWG